MRAHVPNNILAELAGERYISLYEAAGLRGCSIDALKRHPKLKARIVKLSTRQVGMKLKDALAPI
jgi:hypothetical protein